MSRYGGGRMLENKVYVGDLGAGVTEREIEDAFSYYGTLTKVWVARNPPGFAFVEFEDPRDAEDAVRGLDGRNITGRRVRVEMSTGRSKSRGVRDRGPPPRRGPGRPFHPDDRCYECGGHGHYAYDCTRRGGGGGRRRRSKTRSNSRSRSRSKSRGGRSRSRSYKSRTRSRSRSRTPKKSRSPKDRENGYRRD